MNVYQAWCLRCGEVRASLEGGPPDVVACPRCQRMLHNSGTEQTWKFYGTMGVAFAPKCVVPKTTARTWNRVDDNWEPKKTTEIASRGLDSTSNTQ